MFNPFHSSMNQELTSVTNVATVKIRNVPWDLINGATPIYYHLKSEVSIALHCQRGTWHDYFDAECMCSPDNITINKKVNKLVYKKTFGIFN